MIARREACYVILTVALGSVSAFHCPTNQECICQQNQFNGKIEINCPVKNNSTFTIIIEPRYGVSNVYIQIKCINSPNWSDFHMDMTVLTKNENISVLHFIECDLPSNNSLGEISRILGSTNVKKLMFQLDKNMNSTMVKHHLDDFENLKYLNLWINNSYVDKDLLVGLVNLTKLSLSRINQYLVAEFFNNTPELKQLFLVDNTLQWIKWGSFDNLKNQKTFVLENNHLTELQSEIFDKLVAVKTLWLRESDMIKLPEYIFAKLENVGLIVLSINNFTYLPKNLLRNNAKLITVSMTNNRRNMTNLPNEFFANLTELRLLELNRLGLVTLSEDVFWGCILLFSIDLEHNYLQTLPKHIFRDLKKLIELNLSSNDLETLPDHIFSNTNLLLRLDLSKNRIISISKHLFNGLYALEELNMEGNRLMTISNYSFRSLNKLKIAKLSKNHLTLNENHEPGMSPFKDCASLEKLYLANNNISEIFLDWRLYLLRLEELDLKYNNIPYIFTGDMQFVSNRITVDLTHNKIEHIILQNAEKLINYLDATNDAIILVRDNPLHCDCRLYDFLRYIEVNMHPKIQNYFHIIPENLTCQSPKELENVRVTDLKSEALKSAIVDPNVCPEKCNYFVRREDSAFILDCSQRNLTSVPSDIKKLPNHLRIELDFSGNRLTRMPDLRAKGFESVKKLILSHNWITEISLNGLSSMIQEPGSNKNIGLVQVSVYQKFNNGFGFGFLANQRTGIV